MKKVNVILLIIVFGVIVSYIYLKNDGMYVLSNINNSELEWINKYAVYNMPFPNETIIESFIIESDTGSFFLSHNEYMEATILVPNKVVEEIIPEFAKDYNVENSIDLNRINSNEQIQYNVWMPRTVVKWMDKTQRTINYTVMQPDSEYTRIYIFVDKLGWNLFNAVGQ